MTSAETQSLVNALAVPAATVLFSLASYALLHFAAWLKAKTRNEVIATVVNCAGRVAGDISDKLASVPAGTGLQDLKRIAIADGIADVKTRVGPEVKKLGLDDNSVASVIAGELDKLNAAKTPVTAVPSLKTT